VPHARLDNARFTLAKDARLPVALDGQLTLKDVKALDHRRVAVLANDAGPNEGSEFGGYAALRVRPRKFEDHRALAGDRILQHLADLDRCQVRRTVRVGMRHRADAGCSEPGGQEVSHERRTTGPGYRPKFLQPLLRADDCATPDAGPEIRRRITV
jgi:hypothetical protein